MVNTRLVLVANLVGRQVDSSIASAVTSVNVPLHHFGGGGGGGVEKIHGNIFI